MEWYHYFNKKGEESLTKYKRIEDENLVVCQQLSTRRYGLFQNFAAFSRYFQTVDEGEKCFYEMLLADNPRKPYFDIDMEKYKFPNFDEKEMFKDIKEILKYFLGKDYKLVVFSSHTSYKRSYHLIIDDLVLKNYKECEVFYNKIVEKLDPKYKPFFDRCVYKSLQQFRIVGSKKFSKENTKKFEKELSVNFKYPDRCREKIAKFIYLLSVSLISNNSYCQTLCGFSPPEPERTLSSGAACEGDIADVLQNFYAVYSPDDFQYSECKEQNGNLLLVLRRLNPTFCKECDRIHENENPFITVTGLYRNITFYCRRTDENKGVSLGYLGIPEYPELSQTDVKEIKNSDDETEEVDNVLVSDIKIISEDGTDLEEELEEMTEKNIKPLTPTKNKTNHYGKKMKRFTGTSILPDIY